MDEFKSISKFYKNKGKDTVKKNNVFVNFMTKILICGIIFVSVLIAFKVNPKLKDSVYNFVYNNNFSFAKVNNLYKKYFGNILPFENIFPDTEKVFNERLSYNSDSVYKDGVVLDVNNNYLVPVLEGGIVVFIGEKEDYGKTIIVQQVDGVDVWYGNVNIGDIKIYDYVEKGMLLGEVVSDKLYLVFQKEGKYLDYKDYI